MFLFQDDDDSVGFSSLPEQVHRKALKRGFDFTLMVVGESGLGKSTLMQSLFLNTELYNDRDILPVEGRNILPVEGRDILPVEGIRTSYPSKVRTSYPLKVGTSYLLKV